MCHANTIFSFIKILYILRMYAILFNHVYNHLKILLNDIYIVGILSLCC